MLPDTSHQEAFASVFAIQGSSREFGELTGFLYIAPHGLLNTAYLPCVCKFIFFQVSYLAANKRVKEYQICQDSDHVQWQSNSFAKLPTSLWPCVNSPYLKSFFLIRTPLFVLNNMCTSHRPSQATHSDYRKWWVAGLGVIRHTQNMSVSSHSLIIRFFSK